MQTIDGTAQTYRLKSDALAEVETVLELLGSETFFHLYASSSEPGSIYAHVPQDQCPACQLKKMLQEHYL